MIKQALSLDLSKEEADDYVQEIAFTLFTGAFPGIWSLSVRKSHSDLLRWCRYGKLIQMIVVSFTYGCGVPFVDNCKSYGLFPGYDVVPGCTSQGSRGD